jgi:NodT family efflux transporter outer membrane factor (OMF) lipoprotein
VLPGSTASLNGAAVAMNWEVDLWGVARAGVKAQEASYRSAANDLAYARQSIAAGTVKAWLTVVASARQLALAKEMETNSAGQLRLIEVARRVGKAADLEVAQADAQLRSFQDSVRSRTQSFEEAKRALELLLGRYPSAKIDAGETLPLVQRAIPAGIPLDVLGRRPDLVAARNRYEAAFFNVEQARAARLPNLVLTAGAGYLSTDAFAFRSDLGTFVFPVGARLSFPLFDGGRRQTEVEIRTAAQEEAVGRYAQTILTAMQEVENALAADRQLGDRVAVLQALARDNERVVSLSRAQYQVGKVDLFEVLRQENELYRARSTLVAVGAERLAQRVNLHLALGGDFGGAGPH